MLTRALITLTLLTAVLSADVLIMVAQDATPVPSAPSAQTPEVAVPDDGQDFQAPVQEPPEYPAGEFCKRVDDVKGPKDHPCHCRDMEQCTKPEDGQGTGPSENNKCTQWCHKDHCKCKMKCE